MNLEKKTQQSIRLIQSSADMDLHLAFSGGKDSVVIYHLAKKSGVDFKSFYCNTTIDPKGTIKFIRSNFPDVEILQPKESFYKLVERKGLPTRLNRYCCEYLKEFGSIGKNCIEGVRAAESRKRQGRDYIQCDTRKWQKGARHIYPIYDWSDAEVWLYIKENNLPVAPCYYNGFERLGCVGCPLVSKKGKREAEFRAEPKKLRAIRRAIKKGMVNNPQWKLSKLTGGDADKAIEWWMTGKTMNEFDFNAPTLFDAPCCS